jgi:hypothetical protein
MSFGEQHRVMSFPLRLGVSLKATANLLALKDGVSLNYFISVAVAEKISRIEQQSLIDHDPLGKHRGPLPLATGARKLVNLH